MWTWNSFRRELIKERQDGRPASPSASSSTSRRYSAPSTPADATTPNPRKEEVILRRAVEAEFGRVDPDDWAATPSDPVDWETCLCVAFHLTSQKNLSSLLISVIKLPLVQRLLQDLIQYFGVLFYLCDEIKKIEPPAVVNEVLLRERWNKRLTQVLNPLSATYTKLLTGQQLENKHHMKQGRSLHSSRQRDELIWNGIYGVAELLVWLVFRRRDKIFIHEEFNRLFQGSRSLCISESQKGKGIKGNKIKIKRKDMLNITSGLINREVPDLNLSQLVRDSYENMATLSYVSRSDGTRVWGHGLGLLGARKLDLNELLEPAASEEDEEEDEEGGEGGKSAIGEEGAKSIE